MNFLFTVATPGRFSHYLPLYYYAARRYCGPEIGIYTGILGGKCDTMTHDAFSVLGLPEAYPVSLPCPEVPPARNGIMRFLLDAPQFTNGVALITDVDLLLTENPIPYVLGQLQPNDVYVGHRGPRRKPYRPEVTGPDGWRNDFERIAGGFVLVTPEWYKRTEKARRKYLAQLVAGVFGAGWRELDEVILARIVKESGLPMPTSGYFPADKRGIHIGDFKSSMAHRWNNMDKMMKLLTTMNGLRFREMEADPVWRELLRILRPDTELMGELANVRTHLERRGI